MLFKRRTVAFEPYTLVFQGINIEVVPKKIKHVYLHVRAPYGDVQLRVPLHTKDRDIHSFLETKKEWILKKQVQIQSRPQPMEYQYINDEVHYYNGEAYTLKLVGTKGKQHVELGENNTLLVKMKKNNTLASRERMLNEWYKQQLLQQVKHYITKWEPVLGVHVLGVGIKKMKTKWGTCNITTHKIWLNLKLAKKSPRCVEYVVVHEMVHLLERYHNQRFKSLMTQFIPQWKSLHEQLHSRVD